MNWMDDFFTWVRAVAIIVIGPLMVILSLTHGLWGSAIFLRGEMLGCLARTRT